MIKIQIGYVFLVTTNDALKRSIFSFLTEVLLSSQPMFVHLPFFSPPPHSKNKPSKYFSLAKLIRKYSSKSVHKLFSYFTFMHFLFGTQTQSGLTILVSLIQKVHTFSVSLEY